MLSYRAEQETLKAYATELSNLRMPDSNQLETSLDFNDISSTLAIKDKAKQLMEAVNTHKEAIKVSLSKMKAVTGQKMQKSNFMTCLQSKGAA